MYVLPAVEVLTVASLPLGCQTAAHEGQGHVQENIQVRAGYPVHLIFGPQDPFFQGNGFLRGRELRALKGNVGIHIPVQQDRPSLLKPAADKGRGVPAVLREEQGHYHRMHLVHTAELPPEEAGYHVPDHRSVEAGKMQVFRLLPLTAGEIFPETFYYYKHTVRF